MKLTEIREFAKDNNLSILESIAFINLQETIEIRENLEEISKEISEINNKT